MDGSQRNGEVMLDYQKTSENGETVEYAYFIEGDRENTGSVSIDKATGEARMTDNENSIRHMRYASKLMTALESMHESGSLKDSGTIMWY